MFELGLEQWSHLATIAMAIAAILALPLAVWQVRKSRIFQQEASSVDVYTEFLKLAFDHPEFLEVKLSDRDLKNLILNGSKEKFGRYEVYFDLMIVTFEHLIIETPNSEGTKSYIRSYLEGHRDYLCSSRFQTSFSSQMRSPLKEYVSELCDEWRRASAKGTKSKLKLVA